MAKCQQRPPRSSPLLPQRFPELRYAATAKAISALQLLPGQNDKIHFDDAMPGFGYRLRRSGGEIKRSWVVQYRRGGATRRILLGNAAVLSAAQAREQAKKVLGRVAIGEDPQAERRDRRGKDQLG